MNLIHKIPSAGEWVPWVIYEHNGEFYEFVCSNYHMYMKRGSHLEQLEDHPNKALQVAWCETSTALVDLTYDEGNTDEAFFALDHPSYLVEAVL